MVISSELFLSLSIIYFLAAHIGLYKIATKIGLDGKKVLIPFYGTYLLVKAIRKPNSWIFMYYIPIFGFVVWMGIIVELQKLLGQYKFKEHFLGVVFPGIYLTYIGFDEKIKFIGYEEVDKYKKSAAREWTDAIIFALIAATIIRGLYIEAFTIPTSSMEKKLLVGDFLFVSKMAYGSRIPNTPIFFPLVHNTFPGVLGGSKSYLEWLKFPYARFPKLGDVERNDCVVFNFPAGDTVVLEKSNQVYAQLARDEGRDAIRNNYTVVDRPVDKRDNYIKRCVAIPNDTLEIINSTLMINGEEAYMDENVQHTYHIITNGTAFNKKTLLRKGITSEAIYPSNNYDEYYMTLTKENAKKITSFPQVKFIEKYIQPKGTKRSKSGTSIFPNIPELDWTVDNFGPIVIPAKGTTVTITTENLPLYSRIINTYEQNTLRIEGSDIYINDKLTTSYTFKMDYYWMMGDNRHNSQDSRFWGFVPEDHVVGKAVMVWFSWDSQLKEIRWKRLFSFVN